MFARGPDQHRAQYTLPRRAHRRGRRVPLLRSRNGRRAGVFRETTVRNSSGNTVARAHTAASRPCTTRVVGFRITPRSRGVPSVPRSDGGRATRETGEKIPPGQHVVARESINSSSFRRRTNDDEKTMKTPKTQTYVSSNARGPSRSPGFFLGPVPGRSGRRRGTVVRAVCSL